MKQFAKLLQSKRTIRTVNTIQKITGIDNLFVVRNFLSRCQKQWLLKNISYGVWWLVNYNTLELANVLRTPSYISLETVLISAWIIFQDYGQQIFCIAKRTDEKKVLDHTFSYYKIKDAILYNPIWIIQKESYSIACPERAICDRLYLTPNYYFDNLNNINRERLITIAETYDNKRLLLDVQKLRNADNSQTQK